jgi:hypothetical protein
MKNKICRVLYVILLLNSCANHSTTQEQIHSNVGYFEIVEYASDGSIKQIYKTNSYNQNTRPPYNLTFTDTKTNRKISIKNSYMVQKIEEK